MPHVHDGGDGNTAPLVSFLTSAYQTERYVSETIESVLAQTRGDWELIVVDNGNSDEMARIVSNYTSDPRITLIRQENKGIGGGVSAAANAADGRYLCPLDSDDALEPNYCERIGALIEDDPGIDAVGCNAVLFWDPDDDDGRSPANTSLRSAARPRPIRPGQPLSPSCSTRAYHPTPARSGARPGTPTADSSLRPTSSPMWRCGCGSPPPATTSGSCRTSWSEFA